MTRRRYYDGLRCDVCGRFMRPEPGASWLRIPACDLPGEWGKERDRCKQCTEAHGPLTCGSKYRAELVCGVYEDNR